MFHFLKQYESTIWKGEKLSDEQVLFRIFNKYIFVKTHNCKFLQN